MCMECVIIAGVVAVSAIKMTVKSKPKNVKE